MADPGRPAAVHAPARDPGDIPTVSVCMPMARGAREVEPALRSVLAQDLGDFELLIGDETGAVAPLVAAVDDPRVDYHRNRHRLGFAANHVALLDRARGRYLAVLHDDDRWEPGYLSSLVSVFDGDPDVGLACCRTVLDRGTAPERRDLWPVPLGPGRHDAPLEALLREEWFLLPCSTMWRREVWTGPARRWPDLRCGDLQLFLSAAEAGWALYFLDAVLASYAQHRGQSTAWRGSDNGLAMADDVLAFWDGWLEGRPQALADLNAPQRARWHLRQARALLLAGRRAEARDAVARAARLGGTDRAARRRLRLAAALPNPVVRGAVTGKRAVTDAAAAVRDGAGRRRRGSWRA